MATMVTSKIFQRFLTFLQDRNETVKTSKKISTDSKWQKNIDLNWQSHDFTNLENLIQGFILQKLAGPTRRE